MPAIHSAPAAVVAFAGSALIAEGDLGDVVRRAKERLEAREQSPVLLFDAVTSRPVEVDFRGTVGDVLARLAPAPAAAPAPGALLAPTRSPGRPKLGVVAREVTLLPRHWEWLATQPGGASAALRRLVESARRDRGPADRRREAQESAYRFASAMAGDEAGFEEATRALYAGDAQRFAEHTTTWPPDVRDHARALAAAAFSAGDE